MTGRPARSGPRSRTGLGHGLGRTIRLYGVLMAAALRAQGQYRVNLLVQLTGAIAYQGAGFAFVWVVVDRFGQIGGWGLSELATLYGMRLTAHGVFTFFFAQIMGPLDEVVREGDFDRYLVRPLDPLLQVLTRRFNLTIVGDLGGGLALLVAGASQVSVDWTAPVLGYLVLAVLGGSMVESAIQLAVGALTFRMLSTLSLSYAVDNLLATLGGYPLRIFPAAARVALTFVFPLAFVAYFPATVLLGRTGELSVPVWLAVSAPVVGAGLLVLAYVFWRHQMRHYTSSGH